MGISYFLRCFSCHDKLENIEEGDDWGDEEYDEAWEALYEKLDPEYGLSWGKVYVENLLKWVNIHKEHGEIEYGAE